MIQKSVGTLFENPYGNRLFVNFNDHPNIKLNINLGEKSKRWVLELDTHDRYNFLKSEVHAHAFSPWNPGWANQQADLPAGMFMAWCIHRNGVGERHLRDNAKWVEAVKQRQMTGREFLYATAYADEFWSWDIAPGLQRFAFRYFNCMCHRNSSSPLLGKADRCGPDDDFMAIFSPHFLGQGLDAADDWPNFDRFALFLDARYLDYQNSKLETEVDEPKKLAQIAANYRTLQKQIMALAPPLAANDSAVIANTSPQQWPVN